MNKIGSTLHVAQGQEAVMEQASSFERYLLGHYTFNLPSSRLSHITVSKQLKGLCHCPDIFEKVYISQRRKHLLCDNGLMPYQLLAPKRLQMSSVFLLLPFQFENLFPPLFSNRSRTKDNRYTSIHILSLIKTIICSPF